MSSPRNSQEELRRKETLGVLRDSRHFNSANGSMQGHGRQEDTHTHTKTPLYPWTSISNESHHCTPQTMPYMEELLFNQHNLSNVISHTRNTEEDKGTPIHHNSLHCTLKPSLAPLSGVGSGGSHMLQPPGASILGLNESCTLGIFAPLQAHWSAGSTEQP